MALIGIDGPNDGGVGGSIAHAPAGHGIGFGKTVDDDAAFLHLFGNAGNAEVGLARIGELFINFIGNDVKVLPAGQVGQSL